MDMKGLILGLRGLSIEPERNNYGSERADLGSKRADFGPERGLEGMDAWMYRWMDVWKFTPVSYRTSGL